ncbi:DUF362 domain-containing protein [Candidatus Laterigemmans baculatus]|uniref:DUF362 domain-containing protein n=1 Tax=Candidatus Laterigemmans baculatus TaxID=2770505 RepID=UPI0013D99264|nr:DUF362 domain-containing protein [Candidatus Laterigemmans baculatus]
MTTLPKMFRLRQHFAGGRIADPAAGVTAELERVRLQNRIQNGESVAVAVGSRGIADLPAMVDAIVRYVKAVGGRPFVVPAMGSHGGGTADGQIAVLEGLGISEARVGCPIVASMETETIGQSVDGLPIHFDARALAADHLILLNRVKPHTRFTGRIQSGLLKMLMVGLGKRNGACVYHQANQTIPFDRLIRTVVPAILARRSVTLGIAVVENAFDQIAIIEAVDEDRLLDREPQLLETSSRLMAHLPFDQADLLIIDRIGKDISGTGMDTNIIGRKQNDKVAAVDEYPKVRHIYVRGLTEASRGNAAGIGLAEFCRSDLVDQMDQEATRVNALSAGHVSAAAIPIHYATDREVLEAAITQSGLTPPEDVRWMWIRDTLHLSEVLCSAAFYGDALRRDDLDVLDQPTPLEFDAAGQLVERFTGAPVVEASEADLRRDWIAEEEA